MGTQGAGTVCQEEGNLCSERLRGKNELDWLVLRRAVWLERSY